LFVRGPYKFPVKTRQKGWYDVKGETGDKGKGSEEVGDGNIVKRKNRSESPQLRQPVERHSTTRGRSTWPMGDNFEFVKNVRLRKGGVASAAQA